MIVASKNQAATPESSSREIETVEKFLDSFKLKAQKKKK